MGEDRGVVRRAVRRSELAVLGAIVAVKLVVHYLTSWQYDFHRDELYYLDSARHLDLGYVDYPPLTPLIGRVSVLLFGQPPVLGLRIWPPLAGAVLVVLAWLVARELGGGRTARLLAAFATLASPLLLATNWLFQTVCFDQVAWMSCLLLVVMAIRRHRPWLWLPAGVALGVGLETKYTIVALALGLVIGILATPVRAHLRTPWPWLGALAALIILSPNLVWQVQHGWASLDYVRNHRADVGGGPIAYLLMQLIYIGPFGIPLWVAGWATLLRDPRLRAIGIAGAVAWVLFAFVGKDYYGGPLYPLLLAAGACWLERRIEQRRGRLSATAAAIALGAQAVFLCPPLLPVLPEPVMVATPVPAIRKDMAETVGWHELVSQVDGVYRALPSDRRGGALILASNYGEAGAINTYGPARGLPTAYAPELSDWYLLPRGLSPATVILVGYPAQQVDAACSDARPVATIRNSYGFHNTEYGRPIYVCTHLRTSTDSIWHQFQRFR